MENDNLLEQKAISNVSWQFAEKTLTQIVTFVVSIIIARIIEPEAYGIIALINPVVTILTSITDCGLGMALVQKKNVSNVDYSTVFYSNIVICVITYVLIYFVAPFIAGIYNLPELTSLIRVASITIIFAALQNVQQAYVTKKLIFKKFFFASLFGTIIGAIVGIYMAYKGYEAWALVLMHLANIFIDTAIIWLTIKWRPIAAFSFESFKQLFKYGYKICATGMVSIISQNIFSFAIGKVSTLDNLAYYDKSSSITNKVVYSMNGSIQNVLVSILARFQDNIVKIKEVAKKALKVSSYVIAPIFVGLIVISENIISLLLTDKWLPMRPYFIILCFINIFVPIHTVNISCILAVGKSDINLRNNFIKQIIYFLAIIVLILYGPLAMTASFILFDFIAQIINAFPNKRLINYNYFEQIKDLLPIWLISLVMGLLVYAISYIGITSKILLLIIQVAVGSGSYVALSKIFKIKELNYLYQIIREKIKK